FGLADDFKTIDGKEYKNATVSRVEANGVMVKTKGGISKVYFTELPKDVQERFHYRSTTPPGIRISGESSVDKFSSFVQKQLDEREAILQGRH
ncbi:hypothetical protein ACH0C8_15725, partial [Acetobacter lovaniensis]|uniref:hypothetical protein n=1 Tax=Acetobacter lovaniensis TaxID=104100 RepID=UPI003770757F